MGYNLLTKIRFLEKEVDQLGLVMAKPKHYHHNDGFGDLVSVIPKDQNSLPVFSRDAEMFIGTLNDLEVWLRGVEWARRYDNILGLSDDKKRNRKEQDELNRQLVKRLKNEKVEFVREK